MNRLAEQAATDHVGVGGDDLKDKNQDENESVSAAARKAVREAPARVFGWSPISPSVTLNQPAATQEKSVSHKLRSAIRAK